MELKKQFNKDILMGILERYVHCRAKRFEIEVTKEVCCLLAIDGVLGCVRGQVFITGWLTCSQFTDMHLPCVSEGPGGMGTRKSGRCEARGREIRNALRPPAME